MSFIINPYSFGSTFDPLSLSPALWLSDTGSDASVWPDLSGNGRNATQSDAAKRPAIVTGALNGRQVRRFDGVNDCFSHPLSIGANPCSVFIVAKRNGGTNLQHLFAAQAPNTGLSAYVMARSVASPNWHTYFQAQQTSSYSLDGQWRSIALIVNSGTSIAMITDGNVQNFSPSGYFTDGIDRRWIGAENGSIPFIGDIAEILVFPTALSTSNRQAVESYLRNKWGTP